MFSALFYLQARSIQNRLLTRFKRLKKPKYLFGLIIGGLYFYFFLFRYAGGSAGRKGAAAASPFGTLSDYAGAIELLAALVFMLVIVSGWIFPHERAALAFTEAEAVFLFAAPIRRRTLLHFKLLKSQFGILITTLFMALISNRFGARGSPWLNILGWWIILSTLNLHFLGSSFARTRLLERGFSNWQRRLVVLIALGLAAGAILYWARDTMRAPAENEVKTIPAFARYLQEMLERGPAPWLLYPFRLVLRPCLAPDLAGFLAALWPAGILLALHYLWVVRSDVAFEEASLALAQKRSQILSAAKQGQFALVKHKARRGPFILASLGPPAVALLWKNLIAAGSLFRTRSVLIMMLVLGVTAVSVSLSSARNGLGAMVGILVGLALLWSVMLGPILLRHDFRSDLKSMDVLKLYPLPGWRIVLGELLAPVIILVIAQWLLLAVGVIAVRVPGGGPAPFGFLERLSIGCGLALVLPMLNLISFLIPNAAVLLFPAWFQSGQDATQGIEATGQRLIFGLGQFAVFLVALVPAGLVAALVFFLARLAVHWTLAVPLAALPAALVLGGEAALGIGLLGKVFEKFDLSGEPQT